MRASTALFAAVVSLAGCGEDPPAAPAATPTAPVAPVAAPAVRREPERAAPPTLGVAVPSAAVLGAVPSLRAPATPEVLALLRGEHLATRVHATAELARDSQRVSWVIFSDSESLERWAVARRDGTYPALRQALARKIAQCQHEEAGCFDCTSCEQQFDDEHHAAGVAYSLARLSWPAGRAPVLDRQQPIAAEDGATMQFREVSDLDSDGRAEVGVALRVMNDTGQSGAGHDSFFWFDGDTLHQQLTIQRSSYEFGCMGGQEERSGFSVRDRNGDGHPDFGVRHVVWTDRGACDHDAAGWPDPSSDCNAHDERLRFFYDVASDEWRAPDGSTATPPPPPPEDDFGYDVPAGDAPADEQR